MENFAIHIDSDVIVGGILIIVGAVLGLLYLRARAEALR
jgi:hypothetical protein